MVVSRGRGRRGPFARSIVGLWFFAPGLALACEPPQEPPVDLPAPGPAETISGEKDRLARGNGVPPEKVTPPEATALTLLETSRSGLPVVGLEIEGRIYRVELAHTPAARARGMGGRRSFPPGTAMLFVHPDDLARRYWMKGCLVPIDIAFLDREGRITAMHRMPAAPPRRERESVAAYEARLMRYPSRRGARYALELPSGDLESLGLRVGQRLPLPHAPLQAIARATDRPTGR